MMFTSRSNKRKCVIAKDLPSKQPRLTAKSQSPPSEEEVKSLYHHVMDTLKQQQKEPHSILPVSREELRYLDRKEIYDNIPGLAALSRNDRLAWQVCAILCNESMNRAQQLEAFKEWVRDLVSPNLKNSIEYSSKTEDPWSMGFAYLTFGRTTEACEIAIQQGDYALATLFSNPDREYAREAAHRQIRLWQQNNLFNSMSPYQQKMWYVLNGQVGYCARSHYVVTENLDWIQTFGLYLWYSLHEWHSLQDIIRLYEKALDKRTPGIHHQYVLKHTARPPDDCLWYSVVQWWSRSCNS